MPLQYKSSYNFLLCHGNYIIELKNWQYLSAILSSWRQTACSSSHILCWLRTPAASPPARTALPKAKPTPGVDCAPAQLARLHSLPKAKPTPGVGCAPPQPAPGNR